MYTCVCMSSHVHVHIWVSIYVCENICLGMCMHLKIRGWHWLFSSIAFTPYILNPCLTHAQISSASWITPRDPISTSMMLRLLAIHQVYLTVMWMLRIQTLVPHLKSNCLPSDQSFTESFYWRVWIGTDMGRKVELALIWTGSLNWHWYGLEGWIGTKSTSSLWPNSDSSIQFHFCKFG